MPTPTARSVADLRARGLIACKVEQRLPIPGKFVTRDAFNCGDLLCAGEGFGVALVQVTTVSHLAAREKKARDIPELWVWLRSGGRFLLHGWALKGSRGERKRWQLVEREITSADQSTSVTSEEPAFVR